MNDDIGKGGSKILKFKLRHFWPSPNGGFCKFITQLYEQKKVRFIIDEAHCILAYQDFREAWGQLGMLK
ncbi:unnamed protein product [Rhizophagus irregularis]|nr:unnamed protein product [Rhizophagus irregularis]